MSFEPQAEKPLVTQGRICLRPAAGAQTGEPAWQRPETLLPANSGRTLGQLAPRTRQILADLALLFVTAVWGGTFVMVKNAIAVYPIFSFLALRFALAALALLPLMIVTGFRPSLPADSRASFRFSAGGALLIGLALFAGFGFQTTGLHLTTPAKAGFITGLYVVIVPLFGALLLQQSPGAGAWLGTALATLGLALLSWEPGQGFNAGDLLLLCCTVAFAAHILLTGRFAGRINALWLTFGQILVVGALCTLVGLAFETRPPLTLPVLGTAAFTGLLCTSAAFGIQTVAQRFTASTHTALIFAAEPVFAALFSFLLIGEALGTRQLAGCALILGGMLAAELWRRA